MNVIYGLYTIGQKKRGEMFKVNQLRNIVLIMLFIAIIAEGIYLARITGFVQLGEEVTFSDKIGLSFNESSDYSWSLSNKEFNYIKSIKISGYIKGDGTVKVYLENNNQTYLVLNSKNLKKSDIKITGLVVGNASEEVVEDTELNISNEPAVEINKIDESVNISNETELSNIVSNETATLTNITGFINETNISLGVENITNLTNQTPIIEEILPDSKKEKQIENYQEFENICIDTCNIEFFGKDYRLIIQLNNAEFYLDSIYYSVITEGNISYANITNITKEKANLTVIGVSNESEEIQLNGEINKPVKWIKKVNLNESKSNVSIRLRKEATNVRVKKHDKNIDDDISDRIEEFKLENETDVLIRDIIQNITIEYETKAPELNESNINKHSKIITVSSDIHYQNILVYTNITETKTAGIKLYWIKNGSRELFENITYTDYDNNSLVDNIQWIIPSLSNQTFELSLTILNPVEYLRNNDTWIVKFNTTGIADLVISSTNANWEEMQTDNSNTADEMRFINISCNGSLLNDRLKIIDVNNNTYDYANISLNDQIKPTRFLVENYSCEGMGEFSNFMNTAGYAILNFTFGSLTEYAYDPNSNTATCTGTSPPSSGDWNIGIATSCATGVIIMDGNITVYNNASLDLRNVTLLLNNSISNNWAGIQVAGNMSIVDLDGTTATMNDASNISVINLKSANNNRTFFRVYPNANFTMKNSRMSGFGTGQGTGFIVFTPSIIMNNSFEKSAPAITIMQQGNHTNFTSNFILLETAFFAYALILDQNVSNSRLQNITIEYTNITGGNSGPNLRSTTLTDGFIFRHNKILLTSSNSIGVEVVPQTTNLWFFNNSIITNSGAATKALRIISPTSPTTANKVNQTYTDNIFNSSGYSVFFELNSNTSILFVNNSFDYSKVNFAAEVSGGVEVRWYTDINITYSNASVAPNINVTLWNSTGNQFYSFISEADGITRINVTELFINGFNITSLYNNYTIAANMSATSPFSLNFSGTLNITKINPNTLETPILVYNITLTTNSPPNWTAGQLGTNTTIFLATGYMVNFSSNWSDDTALDSYIFSVNQTGLYLNSTSRYFGASLKTGTASNVTRLTAPYGYNITWQFWANDSYGQWNSTRVESFLVTCHYNGSNNWIINTTCSLSNVAFTLHGNLTILDSGNLSLKNVNLTINGTYSKNITIFPKGIFEVLDSDNNNNTINDRSRLNVTNPTICSGTPSGCGTFNDEPSCTAQQGCTWDEGLGQCTGTPSACSTFTDQTSCTNQQGCSWTNSGSYLKANLIALYNSTFIMKNSYAELFGSQNNVFGSNGFDLNGTSVLVNNSFRNLTIYFYNSNLSFQGNVMNITSSDSLRNIVLLNIENSSLIQNYFWNPLTISAITIYAENNTNITLEKNVLIINKSNGITLRESKNITINSNRIDVSDTPNIGGLSLLRTNISNISYNIISTANVNILFQNSSNNTIYGNNLSSSITNTINIVDSLYNLIEKSNIITGNSNDGSGISFGKSHNNTVSDNDILFNQTAIGFVKSDDNYIINVRAKSGNRGANSTNINLNSSNNKIVDSILNATNGSDIVSSGSNFTYYLNVSFNKSSTLVTSSGFVYVQWYLDVNVTYSNNTLAQNTNVTTYNRTGTYYFSDLVAGNGLVPRKNVTEYVQKSSGGEYYTNYTIDANTSLLTVQNYSSVFNITNNMQFNISMVINTIPNFTVIPNISISPVFSPIVAYANSSLNCTATPLDSEQTTLQVNFTWYKNDLRNTSFDSLVTTNNGTSTGSSKLVTGLKNYDNWTCSAAPYDDYWYGRFVNSSSVQISNYVPQVELLIPTSGNTTVTNRTPSFQWRLWDADPEDVNVYDLFIACQSGCSDDNRSQINVTTTTFNLTIDLAKLGDNNFFYNWTVRAFDNESYGSYAENNQRNFSIQSVIVITIINASVNFSTLVPGSYEDTEDDVPNAIGIRNDGNSLVKVNISLLDSGLWRSRPSPTSFFSYKISNFTGPPQSAGAFRWDTSTTTYASIPLVNETAIDLLKYLNLTNNRIIARVDINITVPNDEPGGRKNSTVLFSSMLGE